MATSAQDSAAARSENISSGKIWQVIGASSVGTMIEWYDFYIFGSLTAIIAPLFYPPEDQTFAYIAYLATFAVGFIVRPFGALFFGRIGDVVGRKYAFLVTLLIMGGATAIIGFLPTYAQIGYAAPIILLLIQNIKLTQAWLSGSTLYFKKRSFIQYGINFNFSVKFQQSIFYIV